MLRALAKRLEAQELIAALALGCLAPVTASAQTPPPAAAPVARPVATDADPAVRAQAEALLPVLNGGPGYDTVFAPAFRQAVPLGQWQALTAQLRDSLGAPQRIATLTPKGRYAAQLLVGYERGTATMLIAIDPAAPHAITGLRITGTTRSDDSAATIEKDLSALPGTTRLGIYALDGATPMPVLAIRDAQPAPLGSAFKFWVLAETARRVASGKHRWDEVVPIAAPSLPSGILQTWPAGTPVTLQTLATLMISISDNTAADTLIGVLGRKEVDAMAARFGATGPVLTTREAFAIKADPTRIAAWKGTDAAGRRALLAAQASAIATQRIDPLMFSSGPIANDSVEWFASPRDMARLLAHLRDAGPVVRGILGINPGIDPATAARFRYVGFKGGSEPGVITLNLLAQARDGRWYAVVGDWHRSDAGVDDAAFVALVSRALALVATPATRP
ncbi:serine hydrolase [Sphingomonas sp. TX0522]|uniref:serine hydrolase n=1 Tax=Sphingomonas sp. TX0522 TaxID=2479205 RepID=UPI0018E015AA|nr:serine hydrolase [Sphingomonas sp. TX0522]MBI0530130.1 serine hydrolase [Sphingomonas sp. TX0522]